MAQVKFTGRADARILSAADLAKAGVEGFTKREFRKGEAVEVDDTVAKALIDNSDIFGDFESAEADAEREASKSDTTATETGASQESTGTSANKRSR